MFTVYSENDLGSTLISNLFIDNYMKDANDAQLKVYLYLLRMMNAGRTTSIAEMADQFNHTERDVVRSLRYWEERGLIALEYDSNGDVIALHMVSPLSKNAPSKAPSLPRLQPMAIPAQHNSAVSSEPDAPAVPAAMSVSTPAAPYAAAPASAPAAPYAAAPAPAPAASYSAATPRQPDAASVEAFRSSAKRAQLLFVIEQYIGKPLAPSEVESVYYISEQLHFSDALIDYLLQYCIDRGKKDFRYIEKVAVNWAEHGITTPKQAERAVSSFGKPRKGYAGVKPSANPFNQFEQNQYDFDQLEKEILGN